MVTIPESGDPSKEVINPQINESNLVKEEIPKVVKTEFLQQKDSVNPQVAENSLKRAAFNDLKTSKRKRKSNIVDKFS